MLCVGPLTKDAISLISREIKKKENKEKVIKGIIEPIINAFFMHYIIHISVFISIILIILVMLTYTIFSLRGVCQIKSSSTDQIQIQ